MDERPSMSGTDYTITAEHIQQMLTHGEDAKTEFKSGMPIATFLSRDLSAFANSGGGEILFGIDDTGRVVGTDIPELRRQIANALTRVTPGIETGFAEVIVHGKSVGALHVRPSTTPVVSDAGYFVRVGSASRAMGRSELVSKLSAPATQVTMDDLASAISRQTETIGKLEAQLAEANSPKSKLKDYFVGGAIGAILGSLLSLMM
jgi:predicted HTH transcriptional regulator